jgi:hypothetical protein
MFEGWFTAHGFTCRWWPAEHNNTWICISTSNGLNKQKVYVVSQSQLRDRLSDAAKTLPNGEVIIPQIKMIGN